MNSLIKLINILKSSEMLDLFGEDYVIAELLYFLFLELYCRKAKEKFSD